MCYAYKISKQQNRTWGGNLKNQVLCNKRHQRGIRPRTENGSATLADGISFAFPIIRKLPSSSPFFKVVIFAVFIAILF